jgi:hypothetical protein
LITTGRSAANDGVERLRRRHGDRRHARQGVEVEGLEVIRAAAVHQQKLSR